MIILENLIFELRDRFNEIGLEHYNDDLAFRDLRNAYDTIRMIGDYLQVDIETFPSYKVKRCTVNVATYLGYRKYTRLAERRTSSEPETAPLHVSYDVIDAQRCLTLLFGVTITSELLPDLIDKDVNPVVAGRMTTSNLDLFGPVIPEDDPSNPHVHLT